MKIWFALFLFPLSALTQNLTESEIVSYVNRIDSLIQENQLELYSYPNMSFWGGSLNGYYLDGELVFINSQYGAEVGYTATKVYVKGEQNYEIIYSEHIADWDNFVPPSIVDSSDYFANMTFCDSTFTLLFDESDTVAVRAENYASKRKIKQLMLDYFIECIAGMRVELGTKKDRAVIFKNKLNENFNYAEEWHYPLGVYVNQWGQLSCDGICPEGVEKLKRKNGRIKRLSKKAFYALVDTTHQFISIQATAEQYEYGGSDIIRFTKNGNTHSGSTDCDAGTHSSLHIEIIGGVFNAWVNFTSITMQDPQRFELKKGILILDSKAFFSDSSLKGKFEFTFENPNDADFPLSWKGTFYCPREAILSIP